MHVLASEKNDPDMTNFLEENYLREQVYEIREMACKVTQLRLIGDGLGIHLFDRELLKESKKKD